MWMSMMGCTRLLVARTLSANLCVLCASALSLLFSFPCSSLFFLSADSAVSPSIEPHIFKIQRLAVDSSKGRRDPVRKFPWFDDAPRHQRLHKLFVRGAWQPFVLAVLPGLCGQDVTVHADVMSRKIADRAVKAFVRQLQFKGNSCLIDHALPACHAIRNLFDVIVAQAFVQSR